jgi:hypothetical protein
VSSKVRSLPSVGGDGAYGNPLGGGGGGGGTSGGSGVAPTTPTPTPVPNTISGMAIDYASGAALAGFTVNVGATPSATTCNAAQTATTMPCGVPASPLPTVTTSSTGAFSVSIPVAATYMITVGKDSTYATLHRTIAVSGATSIGTAKIAALSTDEQAWLVDVNHQRAMVWRAAKYKAPMISKVRRSVPKCLQSRLWPRGSCTSLDVHFCGKARLNLCRRA